LRVRDRSIARSRENSRLKGVLSKREKLSKRRWLLQQKKGGGEEKPGGFPSSSSLIERDFFRRDKGEKETQSYYK
jgi:hypothetical protein